MGSEDRSDNGPERCAHCSISGLPMVKKPVWTNAGFGRDDRITLRFPGDRILRSCSAGYGTLRDVARALDLTRAVIREQLGPDRRHVQIETRLRGVSLDAGKAFC